MCVTGSHACNCNWEALCVLRVGPAQVLRFIGLAINPPCVNSKRLPAEPSCLRNIALNIGGTFTREGRQIGRRGWTILCIILCRTSTTTCWMATAWSRIAGISACSE